MIEGKKIFITGGAGFIGSTLAGKLLDRNEVTIFDNFSRDTISGTDFADHPNLKRIKGDVLDAEGLNKASEGAQIFVHAAAIAGIDNTVRKPVLHYAAQICWALPMLWRRPIRSGTVERFLEFSTSEVFGSRAFKVEEIDQTVTGAVGEAALGLCSEQARRRASCARLLPGVGSSHRHRSAIQCLWPGPDGRRCDLHHDPQGAVQ